MDIRKAAFPRSLSSVKVYILSSLLILVLLFGSISNGYHSYTLFNAYAAYIKATGAITGPTLDDPNLKVEQVVKGLDGPTSMVFIGPNDILVLEKNIGTIVRIVNGEILKKPLLQVNVPMGVEYGMLGIAVAKSANNDGNRNVFLYYTEMDSEDTPHNHLYRYELTPDNDQLINPKLLLELPAISSSTGENNNHNGGKVLIGPDDDVYAVIGDVGGHQGRSQNVANGDPFDGTSGIFRITQNGQPAPNNPFIGSSLDQSSTNEHREGDPSSGLSSYYYAYGIRNSFGMDFDPVTGKLWDTENGPSFGDEINLINPGFNSGWIKIQGPAGGGGDSNSPKGLFTFGGKGVYRDPEFTWQPTVGPTALKFLDSTKLGSQYRNDMFVGDVNTGSLYHFKLNQQRDGLALTGTLTDKVASTPAESQHAALGHGFGTITDLQVGPDGHLYVLTFAGSLYRIVPSSSFSPSSSLPSPNSLNPQSISHDKGDNVDSSFPGVLHSTPKSDNTDNNDSDSNNHHTKKTSTTPGELVEDLN